MRLVLASLAATVMFASAACAQDAPVVTRPVLGGFAPGTVTPQVTQAAEFALGELGLPSDQLASIEQVQRQVVAGTNYRFVMVLTDGRKWKVQVWAKLDGSFQLTNKEEIAAQ